MEERVDVYDASRGPPPGVGRGGVALKPGA